MNPVVWKIVKGSHDISPTENNMNSSVDIAVIKSAILEFEQITCNFYPFPVFVLTDGMRWTSCLNLRNLFYSFFFFFFFFLRLFLSLFRNCENLTLWNFKDNLAIPSESSLHLTSMLDKAERSDRWLSQCEARRGRCYSWAYPSREQCPKHPTSSRCHCLRFKISRRWVPICFKNIFLFILYP